MGQLTTEEVEALRNTKTMREWDDMCDKIKSKYGGYPADWFARIMLSGVASEAQANWKE